MLEHTSYNVMKVYAWEKCPISENAGYVAIGKQFDSFSLREKRISSTAVVPWEDDTLFRKPIYKSIIIFLLSRKRFKIFPPRLNKHKWNNHNYSSLESLENNKLSDDPSWNRN